MKNPRNFDPRTLPFFSHQYLFRQRCWNMKLTDEESASRVSRWLFDADMPPDAINQFVRRFADKGTPRNRDKLIRMRGAIDGMRRYRAEQKERKKKSRQNTSATSDEKVCHGKSQPGRDCS